MAAVAIHQFAQCITCHAWCPDQSSLQEPPHRCLPRFSIDLGCILSKQSRGSYL
ncbi:unnamed protein product [Musa acuminata subsp. malaccensis]|uniref:(wild Malaysian banana) hypothetical protein n=1 Tax=Musa acuminata subsp. malaccensis TaxID=214687 RepID=A0A804KTR2_MUSAM|nr:unnamed protein product [Musa acuminata subsp. malaccensis]